MEINRRTVKKKYVSGSLDETRHFYYSDQWQVLEERVDSATTADKQYVWGLRYVDDLVLRDKGSDRLYALQDAIFNVVALTDDTGAVKQRFAYQPYGESEELNPDFTTYTGTNYEWEYRFTGRELDLEAGLQLNRNRFYHARLGRWVNRDPIGYIGGPNLYGYVGEQPAKYADPLGLDHALLPYGDTCGGIRKQITEYEEFLAKDPQNAYADSIRLSIALLEARIERFCKGSPFSDPVHADNRGTMFGYVSLFPTKRTLADALKHTPKTTPIIEDHNRYSHKGSIVAARQGKGVCVAVDSMCPNDLVGTTGAATCVGLIIFDPWPAPGRIFSFHFEGSDDPCKTLERYTLSEKAKAVCFGATEESVDMMQAVMGSLPLGTDLECCETSGLWSDSKGKWHMFPLDKGTPGERDYGNVKK